MPESDKRPLRLLFAIDNLRHGGAQKVLRAILSRLDRDRVEASIWCLGGTSAIEAWYTELGVQVIRYPTWQMLCGIGLLRMWVRLLVSRPALVQTFLFHADVFGRLLSRMAFVPVVVSSVRATNRRKAWWQFLLDRLTASMADRVIAVSNATREFAIEHEGVSAERTAVIANGIDVDRYVPGEGRDEARAELGYGPEHVVVGTIGRLHEQKGHVYLIDALERLSASHPELRAFIVGYGPLESSLNERIQRLGLADRVRLLGYRTDTARLLAAMDVFVLPSLWEGMPNALLEAMAMGLPVVATGVDGNLDLVADGETGMLIPAGDAEALASAIQCLARDADRAREMGSRGRERAAQQFSLERAIESYLRLYERHIALKTGRSGEDVVLTKGTDG